MLGAFRRWAVAAEWRLTALRYLASVGAVLATLLIAKAFEVGDKGPLLGFAVVLACAWWGGIGPSIVAPVLLIVLVRLAQSGGDWQRASQFSTRAVSF
ncbi:MAG: hypothetical protein HY290_28560 [Planctomycetia bacterium]|nr:hypothetical protein [Planctomycetia bacterium]